MPQLRLSRKRGFRVLKALRTYLDDPEIEHVYDELRRQLLEEQAQRYMPTPEEEELLR